MHQARKSAIIGARKGMVEGAKARGSRFCECPAIFDVLLMSQSIIETAPKFPELQESSTAILYGYATTGR